MSGKLAGLLDLEGNVCGGRTPHHRASVRGAGRAGTLRLHCPRS